MKKILELITLDHLANSIQAINRVFFKQVQKQINTALTVRNWMIGYYIFEYEQKGQDRAEYGEYLLGKLAEKLKTARIKGLSFTNLYLCKQLYLAYPQIVQSATEYLQLADYQISEIFQSLTEKSDKQPMTPPDLLLGRLSFTHMVELIKCNVPLQRLFYETEAIKNNWSVRELPLCVRIPGIRRKTFVSGNRP